LTDGGATARARLDADPALRSRVDQILAWLIVEGAAMSGALVILLAGLELKGPAILVIDMVEQGLDKPTQEGVMAHMRRQSPGAGALFIRTRSSAILGLSAVGTDEAIFLCPANHSRPTLSRRARLRGCRHVSGLARGAGAYRRRYCVAAGRGVMDGRSHIGDPLALGGTKKWPRADRSPPSLWSRGPAIAGMPNGDRR